MMANVYPNSDTQDIYDATKDGIAFDLDANSVTRVTMYICDPVSTIYTSFLDSDTGDITWVADVVTFLFGRLLVPEGNYSGIVKFYTGSQPLGFQIQNFPLTVFCPDPSV